MILAHAYAHILAAMHTAEEADRVISYMKKRGHLSLLIQVARILGRLPDHGRATLVVARKGDEKTFREKAALVGGEEGNLATIVDPGIVGGYMVRRGGNLVDATFRRSLVELYRKVTT